MNVPIDRDSLNDAMPFIMFWKCDFPAIEESTQRIWDDVKHECDSSYRALQFLRTLLINITVACKEWQWLAMSRSKNDYSHKRKPGKIWYKFKHVIIILDWLELNGYLVVQKGLYFPDYNRGYKTRYRWTEQLRTMIDTPIEYIERTDEELVKLSRNRKIKRKGMRPLKKSIPLEVPNNTRMRDRETICQRMNEIIIKSVITVPLDKWFESTHSDKEQSYEHLRYKAISYVTTGQHCNTTTPHCLTSIYRPSETPNTMNYEAKNEKMISVYFTSNFCDGDARLLHGGRYNSHGIGKHHNYQHFCQKLRQHMKIDGSKVCEPDFSCMHIRMLYAMEGYQYDGKPYTVDGIDPTARPILKKLLLSIFNTKNLDGIPSILTSYRSKLERVDRPLKEKEKEFLDAYAQVITCRNDCVELVNTFMNAHPKLERYFGSGVGTKLQFMDSEIMTTVLKFAIRNQYPWLPLHDGLVVPIQHRDIATKEMENAYRCYMHGFNCPVTVK